MWGRGAPFHLVVIKVQEVKLQPPPTSRLEGLCWFWKPLARIQLLTREQQNQTVLRPVWIPAPAWRLAHCAMVSLKAGFSFVTVKHSQNQTSKT